MTWPNRAQVSAPLPHALLLVACALAAWFSSLSPAIGAPPSPSPPSHRPKGAFIGDGGPSLAIFPPQALSLRFNHDLHVTELKLGCVDCHDRATTSTQSKDRLLPSGKRCDGCHGTDHRDLLRVSRNPARLSSDCSVCHTGPFVDADPPRIEPVVLPTPNLKFSHALHAKSKIACRECHGDVEKIEVATRDQMPRMRGCLTCHTGQPGGTAKRPSGACPTCHYEESDGRLKTDFASGQLLPPGWMRNAQHGPDWIERHKRVAGADSQFCASCHTEKDCTDCHDGRVRPRSIHPNDFLSLHAIQARQEPESCSSCHRQQSFCVTCHQRSGVAQSSSFASSGGRGRFHPPQWIWTQGPKSPRHHAWEAQKNLNTCTSCHVERDCVGCHSTRRVGGQGSQISVGSGRGVNPHPPGFRARCARPLQQNPRACLFCHGPGDPKLGECR